MSRDAAQSRATRVLGALVLSIFLFGVTSGPLRTCISHPGHGLAMPMADVASSHMAAHQQTPPDQQRPHREHEGCSCLGQCSLEHPQFLSATPVPVLAQTPIMPRALPPDTGRTHKPHDRLSLPLARPPPAVV
jgi:hypothetical protein